MLYMLRIWIGSRWQKCQGVSGQCLELGIAGSATIYRSIHGSVKCIFVQAVDKWLNINFSYLSGIPKIRIRLVHDHNDS